jgi:four helix bundle protein
MQSTYLEIQSRMSHFGANVVKLIPALKVAGLPGSNIDQLVRSATSVGANYAEARGAESRADFIHKLQMGLKECREAKHWLDIVRQMPEAPQRTATLLLGECDELCAILYCSVVTAKRDGKD